MEEQAQPEGEEEQYVEGFGQEADDQEQYGQEQ